MSAQNIERSKLLVCCKKNPRAKINLFCFPYSGAGPAVFRRWVNLLPDAVEVWAVQLPGREARHMEPMNARLYQVVEEAVQQITLVSTQVAESARPFAFYGHSLGAYLAYCVALKMKSISDDSLRPEGLFLSGRRSPDHACDELLSTLTDNMLTKRLAEMGGISAEFAAEPEFLRMALPKLRYDLSLNETALPVELSEIDKKIAAPFWIYRGLQDGQAPEVLVQTWQNFTALECMHSTVPGDHFFVTNNTSSFMPKFVAGLRAVFPN